MPCLSLFAQHVYRKHFLFDTDKRWAQAGDGFHVFELELPRINRTITVSPAICMDLVRLHLDYLFRLIRSFRIRKISWRPLRHMSSLPSARTAMLVLYSAL